MDKTLKQIKPMLCPICGKFYFSELSEDEIDDGETPNTTQCSKCGWFYDLEQVANPDLKNESNKMSLNQYKEWYKQKIKENPKWEYYLDFVGKPEPHVCPVCGEYTFKSILSYDICPICGWEDYGFENDPDNKPNSSMMSLNERKKWFEEQRKLNPKFKAYPPKKLNKIIRT